MSIYEQPPILRGKPEEQLRQMRDYLVRLSRGLEGASTGTAAVQSGVRSGKSTEKALEEVKKQATNLKSLIIKTAERLDKEIAGLEEGIAGIEGSFFYIRYASVENPTPEQMTVTPTDETVYMGVCSTSSPTAPMDPADYTWSRVRGDPGPAALTLQISSSNGNIFQNGKIATVLTAIVWQGGENITDSFDENAFIWTRVSEDSEGDAQWNSEHAGGSKSITVDSDDVRGRATFFCDLIDTATRLSLLE